MIERLGDKQKPCTYCTEYGHTAFKCARKAADKAKAGTYNGLKVSSSFGGQRKPMKKVGKHAKLWMATKTAWYATNKGPWFCHYCNVRLHVDTMTLDHKESRSRKPELRYELSNLVPSCWTCNTAKGSRSHDEIEHVCTLIS